MVATQAGVVASLVFISVTSTSDAPRREVPLADGGGIDQSVVIEASIAVPTTTTTAAVSSSLSSTFSSAATASAVPASAIAPVYPAKHGQRRRSDYCDSR